MKYLYGAAVQGIQNFIFQTNELKDIVGASELVENICTTLFAKMLYGDSNEGEFESKLANDPQAIINAAGNIKYVFESKEECERIVLEFPKAVVCYAPGITVSQAVVAISDGGEFKDYVDELESRLRAQRNRPMQSTNIGLMGILRSRKTGLPVTRCEKDDYLDAATVAKRYHVEFGKIIRKRTTKSLCCKAFGKSDLKADPNNIIDSNIAYNIEDITGKNDWIAVIHADGNGLGQIVQKIGRQEDVFKDFSKKLDKATTEAAVAAFKKIEELYQWEKIIPIRPIVLGGDDFTVICRADLAIDYVTAFIKNFEEKTQQYLGPILEDERHRVFTEGNMRDRLTACAGIAYIKSSYPFYYGYNLAEALCSRAKKDAKSDAAVQEGKALPPSCIMFHKVQDSFVTDFSEIVKRELSPCEGKSFEFGPYYIHEDDAKNKGRWTVEQLMDHCKVLKGKEGNAVKSNLRNWMSLLHDNPDMAVQKLARLKEITPRGMVKYIDEVTNAEKNRKEGTAFPVYDILAIHTINNQET